VAMSIPVSQPLPVTGGRLIAGGDRELPLRATRLEAEACAGLACVVLEQRFANPWPEPLTVSYSLPLPHAAAVAGFAFHIGEQQVVGEIERVQAARARFEQALLEGRGAGLLEQERASLFTQQLGNVPPGAEVIARITLDQPLDWHDAGAWEWRFPTAVAARYLGAPGRSPGAARVSQHVMASPDDAPALDFALRVRDRSPGGAPPESPSHRVTCTGSAGDWQVIPAHGPEAPDRDLVIRWPAAGVRSGLALDLARPADPHPGAAHAYGLLTVVPPLPGHAAPHRRDLVLLVDTSGSMTGAPLERARQVAGEVIESLGPQDTLELVVFASAPRRWRDAAQAATGDARAGAQRWLAAQRAGGATEMVSGMLEALRPRRDDAQRQVVLVTDGLVGFEHEVVRAVRDALAPASRLHCVGIGPAANRALTGACARAGRGSELILGLEEDPRDGARRLLARLAAPVLTELAVEGEALVEAVPGTLPDLYAGAPARIAVRLRAEGGALTVHGRTPGGTWRQHLAVPACAAGEGSAAVVRLYARERVEDLELVRATGDRLADVPIERLGLGFGIATRLTAWVAISEQRDVDAGTPVRRVRQPQALPRGLSAEGLGLTAVQEPPLAAHRVSSCVSLDPDDDGDEDEEDDAALDGEGESMHRHSYSMDAEPPPQLTLRAYVVHRDAGCLVLDIEVRDDVLEWVTPRRACLRYRDPQRRPGGRAIEVEVDRMASTAPGLLEPGTRARLVLRLPADGPQEAPRILELEAGGQRLMVPVSGAA